MAADDHPPIPLSPAGPELATEAPAALELLEEFPTPIESLEPLPERGTPAAATWAAERNRQLAEAELERVRGLLAAAERATAIAVGERDAAAAELAEVRAVLEETRRQRERLKLRVIETERTRGKR